MNSLSLMATLFNLGGGLQAPQGKSQAADPQKKAIDAIEKLGGRVSALAQNDDHLEVDFHLQGGNVTDESLSNLNGLKDIVHLNLGKTKITDAGLARIKGITTLTRLYLEETKITDAGLAELKGLTNLTYLNLYGTGITDRGLEHLSGLSNLKNLYVWQTKVTEAGVSKLKKALPNLDIVKGWEAEEKKEEKK